MKRSCGLRAMLVILLLVLGASLVACQHDKNGASPGGGSSPKQYFNGPSSDLNGGGYTGPDSPQPVASADNPGPPSLFSGTTGGWDCQFLAASVIHGAGIEPVLVNGVVKLKGQVDVNCEPPPKQFNMYLEIYSLPLLGTSWKIITGASLLHPPVGTQATKMYIACKPGLYFIDMQATGKSSNGTPFKAGAQTVMVNITSEACSGG